MPRPPGDLTLLTSSARSSTDPSELLRARDAAAVYDLVSLIHVVMDRPSVCALLERRFRQLHASIKRKYLPGLRSLRGEVEALAEAWGPFGPGGALADRLETRGCDQVAQRLAALLPHQAGNANDAVDAALREVLAPAILTAVKARLTSPDRHECVSSQTLQTCADHCTQGILRFDAQGRCEFRNEAAERIVGLCGRSVSDGVPLDVRHLVRRFVNDPDATIEPRSFRAGNRCVQALALTAARRDGSRFLQVFLFVEETNAAIADRLIQRAVLSRQETGVLRYLLDGLSRSEISAAMNLSVHTVRTYVERIYQKLDVSSRHELLTLGGRLRDRVIVGDD